MSKTNVKDKVTPLQAARTWLAAHPEYEGAIDVTVWRPKGRGGWGRTRQTYRVWASGGRSALSKRQRLDQPTSVWNGHCVVCGRVYLAPVIALVYRDDERAGQPLGPENDVQRVDYTRRWAGYMNTYHGPARADAVYAPRCSIYGACRDCAERLGMELEARWGRALEPNEIECEPAGFVPATCRVVEIDLTRENEE